jgi:prepilin-type processing-associated H-X9-DG protein
MADCGPQGQRRDKLYLAITLVAMVTFLMSVVPCSCGNATETAKRSVCSANLGGIGKALTMYADEHHGRFPQDTDVLVSRHMAIPDQFMCPSNLQADDDYAAARSYLSGQPISPRLHQVLCCCYVYIPGQDERCEAQNVLMYEKGECHNGKGSNVLFGDYHVEWVEPYSKVEEFVAKTRQRLAAASQIGTEQSPR